MKKSIALLLTLATLFVLSACGAQDEPIQAQSAMAQEAPQIEPQDQEAPSQSASFGPRDAFDEYARPKLVTDGKLKIAYVHNELSYENQQRAFRQMQIECGHRGWEMVDIVTSDEAETRSSIINAINQDVDAILFYSVDAMTSKVDLVQMAREKGIGVYNSDNTMVDGVITNSTLPAGIAALNLFYYIGQQYKWDANFAIMTCYSFATVLERSVAFRAYLDEDTVYPEMKLLAEESTDFSSPVSVQDQSFNAAKVWMQKFGPDLNCIFACSDNDGLPIAEAIKQAGPQYKDIKVIAIDGSAAGISYMREEGNPFTASYAQSAEAFIHQSMEVIDQIQVKGLNPGDPGCSIAWPGETIFITGTVVDRNNLPAPGESVHVLFDYYDPSAGEDAWYNWTADGIEPYTID